MFSEIADGINRFSIHFSASHMKMLLNSDILRIKFLLATLNVHHRQSRSISILGTALKVIAGTPDFNDFKKLNFQQQQLASSLKQQISVNTKIQEQINSTVFRHIVQFRHTSLTSERQFFITAVRLWNLLPADISKINNTLHFRKEVYTLFSQA